MKGTKNQSKKRARPTISSPENQRKIMNRTRSSAESIYRSWFVLLYILFYIVSVL